MGGGVDSEFMYNFRSESGMDQRVGKKHLENCLSLRLVPKLRGEGAGVVNSCTHSGKNYIHCIFCARIVRQFRPAG